MKKFSYFCTCVLLFLVIILGACKKFISNKPNFDLVQVNSEAVKQFLTLPSNAGHALRGIVNDLGKAEKKYAFLSKHILKNGMPKWEYTISPRVLFEGDLQNSASKRESDVTAPIFFIPLVDSVTQQVKAFIYCAQTGDSTYRYKLYNRDVVINETPKVNDAVINAKAILACFATFEKSIYKRSDIIFGGRYKELFQNSSVRFRSKSAIEISNTIITQNNSVKTKNNSNCWVFHSQTIEFSIGALIIPFELAWQKNICTGEVQIIGLFMISGGGSGSGGGSSGGTGGGSTGSFYGGWGSGGGSVGGYIEPGSSTGGSGSGGGGTSGGSYTIIDPFGNPISINEPLWNQFPVQETPIIYSSKDFFALDYVDDNEIDMAGADYNDYGEFQIGQTWPSISPILIPGEFIGWGFPGLPENCFSYAKKQLLLKGMKPAPRNTANQYWQLLDSFGVQHIREAKKAVSSILAQLAQNKPVIVGVQYHSGGIHPNKDKATDHFIVIVGSGTNPDGSMYLQYFDNAASHFNDRGGGSHPNNKLIWDPINGTLEGQTNATYEGGFRPYYKVTQVRKTLKP